ncbi:MAG TPA: hypothetical protein IAB85_00475 [Candidatus Coprenecus merdigallinarum]|nr:hypothetical protein [Candidatus Coprenecus merdigallinarum]
MKKVKLLLALSLTIVTVSIRAQETVGGLVCGQTYDYDYIISVLGEPDYVSHDMYEVLVYKEKRPSANAVVSGPPIGSAEESPKEDSFGFAPGVDGWCYTAYYISTDRYSFSHPALPGIEVRVGDPIEKVRRFPGTVREYKSNQVLYWSSEEVDPDDVMWSMYPCFYYNENGVIEEIAYYYD